MLIVEDPTITVECKTALHALLLHINSFQMSLMFIFIHSIHFFSRTSWSWLYGIWDYNYTFTIKVVSSNPAHGEVDSMQLCDKVCQWLATDSNIFQSGDKNHYHIPTPIYYLLSEIVQLILLNKLVFVVSMGKNEIDISTTWILQYINIEVYVCCACFVQGRRGRDRISN